jgi:hypothetical protein
LDIFILETMKAIKTPNIPIKAKENWSPKVCAIYPIIGGPIRKPRKLTLETIVKASPAEVVGFFPATL